MSMRLEAKVVVGDVEASGAERVSHYLAIGSYVAP
jgi:hypothetical protein